MEDNKRLQMFVGVLKASFTMELPLDEDQLLREFINKTIDETLEEFIGRSK